MWAQIRYKGCDNYARTDFRDCPSANTRPHQQITSANVAENGLINILKREMLRVNKGKSKCDVSETPFVFLRVAKEMWQLTMLN